MRQGLVAGAIFAGALAFAPTAGAIDCQLACKSGECKLNGAGSARSIPAGRFVVFPNCELSAVDGGSAEMRYKHKKGWFTPPGDATGPLADVFKRYPADACSVPDRNCLQQRMNGLTGAVGGSGIDNRVSQPAGQGDPCALGFPCGRVLPPSNPWRFSLGDASLSGTWVVQLGRGKVSASQAPQSIGRVERGLVMADGRWFEPGSHCTYAFVNDAGATVVTGEFTVVSRNTQDNLQELLRRRQSAGSPQALAWLDTLMSSGLEWDAIQTLDPMEAK